MQMAISIYHPNGEVLLVGSESGRTFFSQLYTKSRYAKDVQEGDSQHYDYKRKEAAEDRVLHLIVNWAVSYRAALPEFLSFCNDVSHR